ncbi:hypothetical protein pb186bvf_006323 [Paramecium bursaria]
MISWCCIATGKLLPKNKIIIFIVAVNVQKNTLTIKRLQLQKLVNLDNQQIYGMNILELKESNIFPSQKYFIFIY